MNHQSWLKQLKKHRAIAVIRSSEKELAWHMASSLAAGGMQ
ncbi:MULTISPECIES: hypothetical protein [unclassified Microcoleus]